MPRFEVVFPKGVGFRFSCDLDDKATNIRPAKFGEILEGNVVGGGEWLELSTGEGLFLPVCAPDGTLVLRTVADEGGGTSAGATTGGAEGSGRGRFFPWQGEVQDGGGLGNPAAAAAAAAIEARGAAARRPPPAAADPRGGELAALDKKYDKKYPTRRPQSGSALARAFPSPLGQMANSHDRTTAYMHEFRDALEEMGMDTRGDPYLERYAPIGGPVDSVRLTSAAGSGFRAGSRSSGGAAPGAGGAVPSRPPSRGTLASRGRAGTPEAGLAFCGSMVVSSTSSCATPGAEGRWCEGPRNAIVPVKEWVSVKHGKEVQNRCTSGRVVDVSDRNVLCMSVFGEKAVLGCADHGLKEVNIRAGQQLRNLFTKRFGHTEWVTTVCHLPDGRIISGAQDSKLCLWAATGVTCVDLTGHMGAISRVRVDGDGKLAISASYDRTLGVWDVRSKRSVASCTGHGAPVLDFVWVDNIVASGDRSGLVKLWDTNQMQCTSTLKGHKGHITAMLAVPDVEGVPIVLTGAQDGHIRVWDLRQRLNTFNMSCHPGGAVNDLGISAKRDSPLLVSTGADGRLLVMEPRCSYKPLYELAGLTEDFLYSLLVLDDSVFVGDGRGKVSCISLQDGQKQYILEAGENAIRCLGASASCLICAGDDGNAVMFDF